LCGNKTATNKKAPQSEAVLYPPLRAMLFEHKCLCKTPDLRATNTRMFGGGGGTAGSIFFNMGWTIPSPALLQGRAFLSNGDAVT